MVDFTPRKVNIEDGKTPIMYDREIDELAHAILADYKPELLREPRAVDFEHFFERYLDAELRYRDIYNDDPKRPILALAAFTDGEIAIFDRENKRVASEYVPARTIVIDNAVAESDISGLELFTALHEGGHLFLHWRVFTDGNGETQENGGASVICCRRGNIESYGKSEPNGKRTPLEWREHQADYFAAAIAMPNATFRSFVNQLLRENGIRKGQIVIGRDGDEDIFADDLLPEYISETYGVSKRAARIKLRKTGFVVGGSTQSGGSYVRY